MPRHVERHQHLERSQIELRDNHDRLWVVESEVGLDATRRPRIVAVGQFHPTFQTPYNFLPDAKYLHHSPNQPGKLTIDYDGWASCVLEAHKDVKTALTNLAVSIYKDEAAKYVDKPSTEMLQIVYGHGRGPEPVEPIWAAKQGNGWILGMRPYDETIKGDVLLKGYLEEWVKVRFRNVIDSDGRSSLDEFDFTEGQKKRKPVTV